MSDEKASNRVAPHFVLVSDCRGHCVQVFAPDGTLKAGWGEQGAAQDEFNTPLGLVADRGRVFVADAQNRRIQVFSRAGDYLRSYTGDSAASSLALPAGLAVYRGDVSVPLLAVSDQRQHRVHVLTCPPAADLQHRLTIGGASAVASDKDGEFNEPDMMCFSAHGTLWVSDRQNHRVQEFDVQQGKFLRSVGHDVAGLVPRGVAVNSRGELLVCDAAHDCICVFSAQGDGNWKHVRSFGRSGSGEGEFKSPLGIAVDVSDQVYVADLGNARVQVLRSDGAFVRSFGSMGSEPGQFLGPAAVALDDSPLP